jgi:hypothetical protein
MSSLSKFYIIEVEIIQETIRATAQTLSGETTTIIECGNLYDFYELLQKSNHFQIYVEDGQISLVRDLPAPAAHRLLNNTLNRFKQPK